MTFFGLGWSFLYFESILGVKIPKIPYFFNTADSEIMKKDGGSDCFIYTESDVAELEKSKHKLEKCYEEK